MSGHATIQFVSDGRGEIRRSQTTLAPGAGQILLRTLYAGVNRGDVLGLAGAYGSIPDEGQLLGQDIVGVVEEAGSTEGAALVGTKVFGQIRGAWADHAVADVDAVAPLGELDPEVAATLPLPGFTALRLYKDAVRTMGTIGDREILITGGTGAVGCLLTRLLVRDGGRVWLLTRSDDGQEGAVHRVRRVADAPLVDLAFESVGGDVMGQALHRLKPGGHAWWFGEVTREAVTLNFFDFLGSPWQLHHFSSWIHDGSPSDELNDLARLVGAGDLLAPSFTTVEAEDLPAAVTAVRDGAQRDKVVIAFDAHRK